MGCWCAFCMLHSCKCTHADHDSCSMLFIYTGVLCVMSSDVQQPHSAGSRSASKPRVCCRNHADAAPGQQDEAELHHVTRTLSICW